MCQVPCPAVPSRAQKRNPISWGRFQQQSVLSDCHFLSVYLVTSLVPFAVSGFSMAAEHGQNKLGLSGISFVLLCFRRLKRLTENSSSLDYAALCCCLYPSVELPSLPQWAFWCLSSAQENGLICVFLSLSLVICNHLKWMCICSKENSNSLIDAQIRSFTCNLGFFFFFRNASICINKTSFPNISVNKSRFQGCQKWLNRTANSEFA